MIGEYITLIIQTSLQLSILGEVTSWRRVGFGKLARGEEVLTHEVRHHRLIEVLRSLTTRDAPRPL